MGVKEKRGHIGLLVIGVLITGAVSAAVAIYPHQGFSQAGGFTTYPEMRQHRLQTETVPALTLSTVDDRPVVFSSAYKILDDTIRSELREGRPTYALKLLGQDPLGKKIKDAEYDRLRASIAQSYMSEGKITQAYDVAKLSSKRSKHEVPSAAWVGGLAAWRLGEYADAAEFFTTAADSSRSTAWMKSASAFWAARSYAKLGQFVRSGHYMQQAAAHPRTFYGLIALRSLDQDYEFNWTAPVLKTEYRQSLKKSPAVQEALTLSKGGMMNDAIRRLGQSGWLDHGPKQRALLAFALEKDAPALVLHLGRVTKTSRGELYDAALFPETSWNPDQGYKVDKAMVYALIRQESRFDPRAANASGAKGLMQIMPSTARYIAKGIDVSLTHPETNISVGQRYVRHLLMDPAVNNDLFSMAIAYNAGPGNLARWKKQFGAIEDPLLFIESVPSAETRSFVQRVMVNYWIYRIKMGKDNPSLDAVAASEKPEYREAANENGSMQVAAN